jgi:RNA polymerase subunit RPABC4/transcription elongation factor Spt4
MSQVQIFQCPRCKEYISSDAEVCRFCKTPIDAETKRVAAIAQAKENRIYRRNQYLKHVGIGALLFIGGLVITVGSYTIAASGGGGGHFLITWGLMVSGGLDFLYGLVGFLGELRDK